jgi:hypothetical protein
MKINCRIIAKMLPKRRGTMKRRYQSLKTMTSQRDFLKSSLKGFLPKPHFEDQVPLYDNAYPPGEVSLDSVRDII